MSGHYQSHKQQANARVHRMRQEGELHRLAKQRAPKDRFLLFRAINNLFGRKKETSSKDPEPKMLVAPRRQRYAE